MENRAVIEIPIEDLYNHPKNVRKRYTDIEDLTASIRESGIWQNLTVVPVPEEQDKYYVVIGNRRLQAARAAGLKSCPCIIAWNMTEQEQQTTMLLENMQRSDLTPVEEAEGMQMCLDLGLTPADLERKTGLSKTTVKRRLEIAKLDKDILLKQAEGSGSYQLSLSDFASLEKVKDISTRNKILDKAANSANLKYLIDLEIQHQEKRKNSETLKKMFAKAGVTRILTAAEKDSWGYIIWFPKATKPHGNEVERFRSAENGAYDEVAIYEDDYGFQLYGHNERTEAYGKKVEEKKAAEKEEKKGHMTLLRLYREFSNDVRNFVIGILNDHYKANDRINSTVIIDMLWRSMSKYGYAPADKRELTGYWQECESYDVDDSDLMLFEEFPTWKQMIAACGKMFSRSDTLIKSEDSYYEEHGAALLDFMIVLRSFGFSYRDDEQKQIVLGRHELYKKKGK